MVSCNLECPPIDLIHSPGYACKTFDSFCSQDSGAIHFIVAKLVDAREEDLAGLTVSLDARCLTEYSTITEVHPSKAFPNPGNALICYLP